MKRILGRTLLDRGGALVLVVIAGGVFALEYQSSTASTVIFGMLLLAAGTNAAFVLLTPIGKIENSVLYLYPEAQPVVVNLQPQRVELSQVSELLIDKKSIFPRAIFCFSHGVRIYHGFPSRSDRRIKRFLEFLGKDVQYKIIE